MRNALTRPFLLFGPLPVFSSKNVRFLYDKEKNRVFRQSREGNAGLGFLGLLER